MSSVEGRSARWDLHRPCALAPWQCAIGLSIPLGVGGLIAVACAHVGYGLVAVFAALEGLAVVGAFVAYARHARDGETVSLSGDQLVIETRCAERTVIERLDAAWVRLTWDPSTRTVECTCQRRRWSLGRHVVATTRRQFAHELAGELRLRQVAR